MKTARKAGWVSREQIPRDELVPTPEDMPERDLSAWYSGGVVVYNSRGKQRLGRVGERDGNSISIVDGGGGVLERLPRSEVYGHFPEGGLINTGAYTLYVQRKAQRQWRRTYRENLVAASMPSKFQIAAHVRPPSVSHIMRSEAFLQDLFYPVYPATLEVALRHLKTAFSVALTPHMYMTRTAGADVYLLGYNDVEVATYNATTGVLSAIDGPLGKRITNMFEEYADEGA